MIDPITALIEKAARYAVAHDSFLLGVAALVTVAVLTWLNSASHRPRPIVRTTRDRD
ncbi:MAG: hypothetical protein U0992_01345 [Planctomycetaceae bacterium]